MKYLKLFENNDTNKVFLSAALSCDLDDMNKILLYPGSIKVIKIYQHNNIPNNIVNDIIFSINNANSI
jgi:hypothetical protein